MGEMMRYWAVFTMCLISIAVVESELNLGSAFSDEEVTRLLGNRRFIRHQIGCVLNKARCDKTGNQLKMALPEVFIKNCKSCNPQQKANVNKVIDFIQKNYPDDFAVIKARYGGRHHG